MAALLNADTAEPDQSESGFTGMIRVGDGVLAALGNLNSFDAWLFSEVRSG